MKKLWTGHKTSKFDLDLGGRGAGVVHHLIIVTICAKLFQNPLHYEEVLDQTQYNYTL
jgi:hypothetical protein